MCLIRLVVTDIYELVVPFSQQVTDDLDFGLSAMSKNNRKEKWFSEDPNTLGHLINELRGEIGVNEMVEVKKVKPSSGIVGKKSGFGGDAKLIDGPDDYAYSKLNPQPQFSSASHRNPVPEEVVPEEESVVDTVDVSHSYSPYRQTGFDYPYVQESSYQYPAYQYPNQYSYHGYPTPGAEMRPGDTYHQQQRWQGPNVGYATHGHSYFHNGGGFQNGYPAQHHGGVPIMHYQQQYPGPNPRGMAYGNPNMPYPAYAQQPGHGDYYHSPPPRFGPSKNSSPYHPSKSIHSGTNSYNPPSQQKQSSSDSFDGLYQDGENPVSVSANSNGVHNEGNSKNKSQLKRFRQLIEAQASNVLHVKGLENEQITAELLSSLFSNFGNIQKLLFVKAKKAAFIVYENPDLATIAKEMLSNLRFMECHLKVVPL